MTWGAKYYVIFFAVWGFPEVFHGVSREGA